MSKQDLLSRNQSYCTLKINIDCHGCEKKIKKLLLKIQGVDAVNMDAKEGKVLVVGSVDPAELMKKLKKLGKHAEILDSINNQLQDLKVDNNNGKGSNGNKSHNHNGRKESSAGGGQLIHSHNFEEGRDLKIPSKQHKSVKSNLHNLEFDSTDDNSHHELHHINFDDDCGEEEGEGHLHGHGHQMPVMGNRSGPRGPAGMMNNGSFRSKGNGGGNNGNCKKGENQIEGKSENTQNGKSDGGFLGRFLGCGKNSRREQVIDSYNKNFNHNNEDKKEKNSCNNLERQQSGRLNASGKKSKINSDFRDNYNVSSQSNGRYRKNDEDSNENGSMGPMDHNIRAVQEQKGPMKNSFDFRDDYNVPSQSNGRYRRNGKDSNGNGSMGQMGPMDHNIRAVQEQQGSMKNSFDFRDDYNVPSQSNGRYRRNGKDSNGNGSMGHMGPMDHNIRDVQEQGSMKNSFDFCGDYNVPSQSNDRYRRNGKDSNGNGNMGQMGPIDHNIRVVQEQQGPTKNSFDFRDDYNVPSQSNGRYRRNGKDSNRNGNMGQMDPMDHNIRAVHEQQGPTKNSQSNGRYRRNGKDNNGSGNMGQMDHNIRAVQEQQGPTIISGGGDQEGMQMQMEHPSYQQQQRMAMMRMMKQQEEQQANGNNMFPSARMYDRPDPSVNYMPPPPSPSPPPPSMPSPVKHTYSEENAAGCTIV